MTPQGSKHVVIVNPHNYSCVDGNFYVIYNKLNDFHTTGWILLMTNKLVVVINSLKVRKN